MSARYDLELEPEVRLWLSNLSDDNYIRVERKADRLAENPHGEGMPLLRPLGDGLFELRFHLGPNQQRITYWITADRHIILLTVFRKARMNEHAEVERARKALLTCAAEHKPATEEFNRHKRKET